MWLLRQRKRHLILGMGVLTLFIGAALATFTVSRLFWYPGIYFYYYSYKPFLALGTGLCVLGGLLVVLYVLIKVREIYRAKRAARSQAPAKPVGARAPPAQVPQQPQDGRAPGVQGITPSSAQPPAPPEWAPPPLAPTDE